ncbi:hypothetical protein PMKS-003646 [Pichia membranifaciens]|uniref:Uncharacterized protein n=1 Tax=Pichia membranifaciens TaxID=4926 RepID=A0A1Q2YKT1_9ASCO|nr:hypothetical protein PMKS-003646 [Pichia membranifaciens]
MEVRKIAESGVVFYCGGIHRTGDAVKVAVVNSIVKTHWAQNERGPLQLSGQRMVHNVINPSGSSTENQT